MGRVSAVHHVAMGVKDLETMQSFYRDILGFTEVFAEFDEAEQELMHEVVRSSRVVFGGVMLSQRAGGIMLELIRRTDPVARPIRKDFRYGDIGVAKITIAVPDAGMLYEELKGNVDFSSEPKVASVPGRGDYAFVYVRDPEGNLVELAATGPSTAVDGFGGICSIGLAVTDLERSLSFYRNIPGLEGEATGVHEGFSGLVDEISGGEDTRVRSCFLAAESGEGGWIELFEVLQPRGRSIPFSANWGDYGYLQVGFHCDNVQEMVSYGEGEGIDFLCRPKIMVEGIPEHPGEFVYARDPDGIPIEFLHIPH